MLRTKNWEVDRNDVLESETPEPTETHKTIAHGHIVETSEKIMEEENLTLKESKYYLTSTGCRSNSFRYHGCYKRFFYIELPYQLIKKYNKKI